MKQGDGGTFPLAPALALGPAVEEGVGTDLARLSPGLGWICDKGDGGAGLRILVRDADCPVPLCVCEGRGKYGFEGDNLF
jgi:hypothetical protein